MLCWTFTCLEGGKSKAAMKRCRRAEPTPGRCEVSVPFVTSQGFSFCFLFSKLVRYTLALDPMGLDTCSALYSGVSNEFRSIFFPNFTCFSGSCFEIVLGRGGSVCQANPWECCPQINIPPFFPPWKIMFIYREFVLANGFRSSWTILWLRGSGNHRTLILLVQRRQVSTCKNFFYTSFCVGEK